MGKYDLTLMITDCKVKGFMGAGLPRFWLLSLISGELSRMANHASALKAHRQNLKHRNRNRSNRSSLRTTLKQFGDRLETGKAEEAKNSLSNLYAAIDKSQQKKAISKNAAARQKSRLTRRLNAALSEK
jgi:small subunit ribosomal protein S20